MNDDDEWLWWHLGKHQLTEMMMVKVMVITMNDDDEWLWWHLGKHQLTEMMMVMVIMMNDDDEWLWWYLGKHQLTEMMMVITMNDDDERLWWLGGQAGRDGKAIMELDLGASFTKKVSRTYFNESIEKALQTLTTNSDCSAMHAYTLLLQCVLCYRCTVEYKTMHYF